eukprot:TRINITY_DN7485_c0_g1_i1.p1 TRINITY_DN7485_c0_g1~~TRINITY_DN7485_c0_g1_i1.p1  ORF type:complete len:55 (-),score=0.41 TRINITY_DN7485_c0_g1_i1:375-539(-)
MFATDFQIFFIFISSYRKRNPLPKRWLIDLKFRKCDSCAFSHILWNFLNIHKST